MADMFGCNSWISGFIIVVFNADRLEMYEDSSKPVNAIKDT